MPASLGRQAMAMARDVSAMNRDEEYAKSRALRDQLTIQKDQKENLTKQWAGALVKNPEVAKEYPADAPPGVLFSAQVLAAGASSKNLAAKRQKIALDAETNMQAVNAGLGALASNNPALYTTPVLAALSRVRDGRSDYKVEKDGSWSYTRDSDGSRQYTPAKDAKYLTNYLQAHSDPRAYMARKTVDVNRKDTKNRRVMELGGDTWISNDGNTTASIYKDLSDSKGTLYDKIVLHTPQGPQVVEGDGNIAEFYKGHKSVKDEQTKGKFAKSQQERTALKPTTTVRVGTRNLKISTALSLFNSFTRQLRVTGSGMEFLAALMAPRKEGEELDLSGLDQQKASALAQITELSKTGTDAEKLAVEEWRKYYNALFVGGGGDEDDVTRLMNRELGPEGPRDTALPRN